jgi:hypothetical protein
MGSENAHACARNAEVASFGFHFFLVRHHKDGDEFLNHVVLVTRDETWVSFVKVETKEQSKQWLHIHSPNNPKKIKETLSTKKLMTTVFCDRKGVLMMEFMQQGTTITSEVYCETLKRNCVRRGMLTFGVVLLRDHARPHTAACTRALLKHFNWELSDQPPCSPHLAPSDQHLVTYQKTWMVIIALEQQ